jgi:CxxC motif-containing protein
VIKENQKLIRLRSEDKELTCIVCPIGCQMSVDKQPDGELKVTGNRCKRGAAYAAEEFNDPRRVVTATAAVSGGAIGRLPVRSVGSVPVDRIAPFLAAIYELRLEAPIPLGETVAADVAGTGIDLVATMHIPHATEGHVEGEL